MKKVLLGLVAIGLVSSLFAADLSGKYRLAMPLIDKDAAGAGATNYSLEKGEIYIKGDNIMIEADLDSASDTSSGKVDQAYGKVMLGGGELKFGIIETGIGYINAWGINYGFESNTAYGLGGEIEGTGVQYCMDMNGMELTVGNFGNLLANKTTMSTNRQLFAGVSTKMSGLKIQGAVNMMTNSSEKSGIVLFGEVVYTAGPLEAGGAIKMSNVKDIASKDYMVGGAFAAYQVSEALAAYGSLQMALGDDSKSIIEREINAGASMDLGSGTSVAGEVTLVTISGVDKNQLVSLFLTQAF